MNKLVLLRHGESIWNLENKFTGWTNVELSEKGVEEAKEAGKKLKENGFITTDENNNLIKGWLPQMNAGRGGAGILFNSDLFNIDDIFTII